MRRSFRGRTPVSIVEKLSERMGTTFPSLKCFKTRNYGRHCEPLSGQNAPNCRTLHIRSHIFFGGDTPGPSQKRPRCHGPRRQFPLGSPAFPLFLFCETTTGQMAAMPCPVTPARPVQHHWVQRCVEATAIRKHRVETRAHGMQESASDEMIGHGGCPVPSSSQPAGRRHCAVAWRRNIYTWRGCCGNRKRPVIDQCPEEAE